MHRKDNGSKIRVRSDLVSSSVRDNVLVLFGYLSTTGVVSTVDVPLAGAIYRKEEALRLGSSASRSVLIVYFTYVFVKGRSGV